MRRLNKRAWVIALILFTAFIALITLFRLPFKAGDPYSEVATAMRAGDYRRAIETAERIAVDHPQDYQMQEYLGGIYLMAGEMAKAEEAYSRAYALYPSESIKKTLSTIQKQRASPSSSPSATPQAR